MRHHRLDLDLRRAGVCHCQLVAKNFTKLRSCVGSATHELAVEDPCQHLQTLSRQAVLGEEISRVGFTKDLPQVDPAAADGVLDPQGVRVQAA